MPVLGCFRCWPIPELAEVQPYPQNEGGPWFESVQRQIDFLAFLCQVWGIKSFFSLAYEVLVIIIIFLYILVCGVCAVDLHLDNTVATDKPTTALYIFFNMDKKKVAMVTKLFILLLFNLEFSKH